MFTTTDRRSRPAAAGVAGGAGWRRAPRAGPDLAAEPAGGYSWAAEVPVEPPHPAGLPHPADAPHPADVPHPADTPGFEPLRDPAVELDPGGAIGPLVVALRALDRAAATAVRAAAQLDGRQVVAEEGMTLDAALRAHTGTTRTELSTVLTAAQTLATMPATTAMFDTGLLSWGHIRALTSQARRLDATTRAAIDAHLHDHQQRLAAMDGEGRLAALDDAITHHRPAATLEDRAHHDPDGRLLILTPRLDGTGTLFGDLDAEGFATVADRLDTEADTPRVAPPPGDGPTGMGRATRQGDTAGTRPRLLADALVRLCTQTTRTSPGTPVRFTITMDTDTITDTLAATIRPALAARPPRLVRRAVERLACDAAYDLIVRHHTDLLAAQRYAPDLTAAIRRAVAARDEGCRFPGCRAPVSWCDVHHVQPRDHHGDHALTNLVLLCRRHHTTIHRRGWTQHLHPEGTYQLQRRGRTWTTLPRTLAQLPPPSSRTRDGPTPHSPARDGPPDDPGPTMHGRDDHPTLAT